MRKVGFFKNKNKVPNGVPSVFGSQKRCLTKIWGNCVLFPSFRFKKWIYVSRNENKKNECLEEPNRASAFHMTKIWYCTSNSHKNG